MKPRSQSGVATIEFALGGATFFIVLIGIIEVARALFTWNGLVEATRRGARVAAVCPVNHSAIERVALFHAADGAGPSPILKGLGPEHIRVDYLDESGDTIANPARAEGFVQIRYVRVRISGYQHALLIPFLDLSLEAPAFDATLPRESLGVPRDGVAASCFGSPV